MSKETYWTVSVESAAQGDDSYFRLVQSMCQGLATCEKFNVPALKVGTLDSLMALSDSLVKTDHSVENITRKLGQYLTTLRDSLNGSEGKDQGQLQVSVQHDDGRSLTLEVGQYLEKFSWIERRFPKKLSCQSLTDRLAEAVTYVDDQFRAATADYSVAAQKVAQMERSLAGNLAQKDLRGVVNPSMVHNSETFATVFVCVPLKSIDTWNKEYVNLVTFSKRSNSATVTAAVPESSTEIARDKEFVLVSVLVLRMCVDEFKKLVRTKLKLVVRDYTPADEEEDSDETQAESNESLRADLGMKQNKLYINCKVWFSEVFSAWAHLRALRVHVESILRFGLPPHFDACIIRLNKPGNAKKLHDVLDKQFRSSMTTNTGDDENSAMAGLSEAFYPYVFFDFNLDYSRD